MILEVPQASGCFTDRVAQMRMVIDQAGVPWLRAVEQSRFPDAMAMQERLAEVVHGGGRSPDAASRQRTIETGRSAALLKVTPWLDAEARVVAHFAGQGK